MRKNLGQPSRWNMCTLCVGGRLDATYRGGMGTSRTEPIGCEGVDVSVSSFASFLLATDSQKCAILFFVREVIYG